MKKTLIGLSIAFFLAFPGLTMAATQTLRIGYVTDWEYGEQDSVGHKIPAKAKRYLKSAVNALNNTYQPSLVIGGGDYISSYSVKKKQAKSQLRSIVNVFRKAKGHRMYLIGNHDVRALNKKEVMKGLNIDYSRTFYDTNGFRIVLLDTNYPDSKGKYPTVGRMTDEDLVWLDGVLTTTMPVVIFSHHSPIHTPDGDSTRTNMTGAGEVRAVIEQHPNVVAVFSGHHPINYHEQRESIDYLIINNLGAKKSAGAFAVIDLSMDDNQLVSTTVNQYGKMPATYNLTKSIALPQ